jgi:hypothetical protein
MRGGDLPATDTVAVTDAELYDAGLAEAVGRFQSRHLEKPLALADYLLAGNPDWSPERIRSVIAKGRETTIWLKNRCRCTFCIGRRSWTTAASCRSAATSTDVTGRFGRPSKPTFPGTDLRSPHSLAASHRPPRPRRSGDPPVGVRLLVNGTRVASRVGVLAAKGRPAGSLVIMSGFRTPAYNAAIGNQTVYSRHLWGDAADVYVDADGNGVMDDLNGDGRSDVQDARVLAGWIDQAVRKVPLVPGGLAAYRRTAAHGPFVHVDARGFRARW